MQLTRYTDYSLRILIYLARKPEKLATISDITRFYGISNNHLTKIVNHLAHHGILHTLRGRHGGIQLALSPQEIKIGDIVRMTEPNLHLAECFDKRENLCVITHNCGLQHVLREGLDQFLAVLDHYTLADIISNTSFPGTPVIKTNENEACKNRPF